MTTAGPAAACSRQSGRTHAAQGPQTYPPHACSRAQHNARCSLTVALPHWRTKLILWQSYSPSRRDGHTRMGTQQRVSQVQDYSPWWAEVSISLAVLTSWYVRIGQLHGLPHPGSCHPFNSGLVCVGFGLLPPVPTPHLIHSLPDRARGGRLLVGLLWRPQAEDIVTYSVPLFIALIGFEYCLLALSQLNVPAAQYSAANFWSSISAGMTQQMWKGLIVSTDRSVLAAYLFV